MKVTAKIQSTRVDSPAVDLVWARDTDAIGVMQCVAQILEHAKDATYTKVLAISVEL